MFTGTNNYEDSHLNTACLFICLSKTHCFNFSGSLCLQGCRVNNGLHSNALRESGEYSYGEPLWGQSQYEESNGSSVQDAKAQSRIPWWDLYTQKETAGWKETRMKEKSRTSSPCPTCKWSSSVSQMSFSVLHTTQKNLVDNSHSTKPSFTEDPNPRLLLLSHSAQLLPYHSLL